uniref:Immunoglobulin heavy variable 7-1 n=1 Tax=Salmo trutta TaxID=8032 RepID=A0A673XT30_SALTR
DITLTQPGSMVVRPEESVTIPCKVTGYSVTSTCTNWIRHSEGKAMEWIGYLCSSSSSGTTDSLKSKISFTVDSSSSTVFLQGKNFQTEDTAVYYCARISHCDTNHCQSCAKTHSLGTYCIVHGN